MIESGAAEALHACRQSRLRADDPLRRGACSGWGPLSFLPISAGSWTAIALAFSAGTFLCIALSDLLPELQFHSHDRLPLSAALLTGFALMAGAALAEPSHPRCLPAAAPHSTRQSVDLHQPSLHAVGPVLRISRKTQEYAPERSMPMESAQPATLTRFAKEGSAMVKRVRGLVLFAVAVSGCAHDSEWLQRQDPVESTIGRDPNKAPAGKVMPPPGMGVDLGHAFPTSRTTCKPDRSRTSCRAPTSATAW